MEDIYASEDGNPHKDSDSREIRRKGGFSRSAADAPHGDVIKGFTRAPKWDDEILSFLD